jgi:hypothetical protein
MGSTKNRPCNLLLGPRGWTERRRGAQTPFDVGVGSLRESRALVRRKQVPLQSEVDQHWRPVPEQTRNFLDLGGGDLLEIPWPTLPHNDGGLARQPQDAIGKAIPKAGRHRYQPTFPLRAQRGLVERRHDGVHEPVEASSLQHEPIGASREHRAFRSDNLEQNRHEIRLAGLPRVYERSRLPRNVRRHILPAAGYPAHWRPALLGLGVLDRW